MLRSAIADAKKERAKRWGEYIKREGFDSNMEVTDVLYLMEHAYQEGGHAEHLRRIAKETIKGRANILRGRPGKPRLP